MSNSRIPGRNFLFIPGPTNLPDRVIRAMSVVSEDHRSPKFPDLVMPLFPQLKKVFKTETGQAFIFPASGTGGWEAAITNTLSPGDKVIAQRFGQFSHLWIDLCKRLGLDVIEQDDEWGTGNNPERIEETLRADKAHEIKAVLATHNETATGVTSDLAGVRKAIDAASHPALLLCRRSELHRLPGLPHGRMGHRHRRGRFAERLHAAGRPRPAGSQPEGPEGPRIRSVQARFSGHQRPYHATTPAASFHTRRRCRCFMVSASR